MKVWNNGPQLLVVLPSPKSQSHVPLNCGSVVFWKVTTKGSQPSTGSAVKEITGRGSTTTVMAAVSVSALQAPMPVATYR